MQNAFHGEFQGQTRLAAWEKSGCWQFLLAVLMVPLSVSGQAGLVNAVFEEDPERSGVIGVSQRSESEKDGKPRLFVDCPDGCDEDLIKSELTFINYVRDREVADIHLLVTTQPAGNLGKEYTLTFIGLRRFAGIADTLKFVTVASDTDDLIRRRLVNSIKLGLMRYIARTPLADDAEIAFPRYRGPVTPVADPWDSWVFYADASTEFQGQKSEKDIKLSGSFSVNRVTEDLKFRLRVSMSYAENRYDYSDAVLLSIARSGQVSSLIAVGLGEHWSTGLFASLSSSTFNNTQLWANVGPALEVDLFPYSQHSRRQFPIMYKMQYNRAVYISETIYDRTSEKVFSHSLSVGLDLKEPWGTVSVSAEGSQYFHDLSKNRLVLQSKLSFRLLEGFSLWLAGSLSMIHDQITLPKLDATPAEVLLNRRELETDYYYYAGIGLSFTFGSIYSNIVNPRFGN